MATLNGKIDRCNNVLDNARGTGVQNGRQGIPDAIIHNFATMDEIIAVLKLDPSVSHLGHVGRQRFAARIHQSGRKLFMLSLRQGAPMSLLQWLMNERACTDDSLPLPHETRRLSRAREHFVEGLRSFQHHLQYRTGYVGQGAEDSQASGSGQSSGSGQVPGSVQVPGGDQSSSSRESTSTGTTIEVQRTSKASGTVETDDERDANVNTASDAQQTEIACRPSNSIEINESAGSDRENGGAAESPTMHTQEHTGREATSREGDTGDAGTSEGVAPTQHSIHELRSGDRGTAGTGRAEQVNDDLYTNDGALGRAETPSVEHGTNPVDMVEEVFDHEVREGREMDGVDAVENPIEPQEARHDTATERRTGDEQEEARVTQSMTEQAGWMNEGGHLYAHLNDLDDEKFAEGLWNMMIASIRAQKDTGEGPSNSHQISESAGAEDTNGSQNTSNSTNAANPAIADWFREHENEQFRDMVHNRTSSPEVDVAPLTAEDFLSDSGQDDHEDEDGVDERDDDEPDDVQEDPSALSEDDDEEDREDAQDDEDQEDREHVQERDNVSLHSEIPEAPICSAESASPQQVDDAIVSASNHPTPHANPYGTEDGVYDDPPSAEGESVQVEDRHGSGMALRRMQRMRPLRVQMRLMAGQPAKLRSQAHWRLEARKEIKHRRRARK